MQPQTSIYIKNYHLKLLQKLLAGKLSNIWSAWIFFYLLRPCGKHENEITDRNILKIGQITSSLTSYKVNYTQIYMFILKKKKIQNYYKCC